MWQILQQFRSEPAGAATRIHQKFVTAQFQTRKNFLAPTDLWAGEAVIGSSVPFAGLRRSAFALIYVVIPSGARNPCPSNRATVGMLRLQTRFAEQISFCAQHDKMTKVVHG